MRWPFIIQKIHFRYWSMYSSCSFKIHSTLHPLYCKPFYQSLCSDIISRNSMLLLMYRLVYRLYIFDVLKTSVRLMKEWNGDSWQETGCGWCKKLISQVSLGIQQAFHFTILLTMKWPFIIQEILIQEILSECVGHKGVHMIKNIVIAAQSQDRSAKVGSSRKIPDVTKK